MRNRGAMMAGMGLMMLAALAGRGWAAETAPAGAEDANQLSLQVTALRTLYTLDLSVEQLGQLKVLARGAGDMSARKAPQVTPKLMEAIRAARAALEQNDDDAISDADDALDEAWDAENFEVADSVAVTDVARLAAPSTLKLLKPEQLVSYIAQISSDVFDPVDGLMDAAAAAPGKSEADFAELRDKTAEDVSFAVAGMDKAKADALKEKVGAWLTTAHQMKPEQVADKADELKVEAQQMVGDVDSLTVVRNEVERNLAELLANPQVGAMIDVRIKAGKAK